MYPTINRATSWRIVAVALAAIAAALGTGQAVADDKPEQRAPSADRGGELARRLCIGCHAMESVDGSVPAGIPALNGIANRPDQTSQRIKNALIAPHAPMPEMRLSLGEILDLTAYLDSLRTAPGLAPLLPPQDPGKPTYPKPS